MKTNLSIKAVETQRAILQKSILQVLTKFEEDFDVRISGTYFKRTIEKAGKEVQVEFMIMVDLNIPNNTI